ncbi:MAG: EamA family transporter [Alphaproteobacteria bacterium]|nr:EamA family transporter [Alphaproteobacteria bacterium]
MKPRDIALAVVIAAIWGFNFIAIKLGVTAVPPFFLTALRFMLAAFPALLFIARPKEGFGWVAGFGLVLGVGQFGFLFLAVRLGLPAGLTSLVMQAQAFWTMLFAWMMLREVPTVQQVWGAIVGFLGIAIIAYGRWSGSDLLPLLLCILAAAGWAAANIVSKMARPKDTLSFVIWSSLAVPLPMLVLSWIFEDHAQSLAALTSPSWQVVGSLLYLAFLSTLFGYGAWNYLFNHYPASTVAPYSMLVPLFGILGGALAFGERFDGYEIAGAVLIVAGLVTGNFGGRLAQALGIKKAEPAGSANS